MAMPDVPVSPWPWHAIRGEGLSNVVDRHEDVIATVGADADYQDEDMAYQNARLMAQAPMMYRVLIQLRRHGQLNVTTTQIIDEIEEAVEG